MRTIGGLVHRGNSHGKRGGGKMGDIVRNGIKSRVDENLIVMVQKIRRLYVEYLDGI